MPWFKHFTPLPEKFTTLRSVQDNLPVVGMFNISFRNFSNKAYFPWRVLIRIHLQKSDVSIYGLPNHRECEIAYAIEKSFMEDLPKICPVHYVGHTIHDGNFDIYWHTRSVRKLSNYLIQIETPDRYLRKISYNNKLDVAWQEVAAYLG